MNYKNLTPQAERLLMELRDQDWIKPYVLVGGSALALHLGHRLSEDLDFILDAERLNIRSITRTLNAHFPGAFHVLKMDDPWQLDAVINEVKVTFFSRGAIGINFEAKQFAQREGFLSIGSVLVIGVLKMIAIAHRNTMRDYYDLYYIVKKAIPLSELIQKTRELVPTLAPITYTETLLYTDDIPEESIAQHLNPTEIVTKQQIAAFFEHELLKIRDEI